LKLLVPKVLDILKTIKPGEVIEIGSADYPVPLALDEVLTSGVPP
jgi:hypothetical protein